MKYIYTKCCVFNATQNIYIDDDNYDDDDEDNDDNDDVKLFSV